jgi:hypothetical protein
VPICAIPRDEIADRFGAGCEAASCALQLVPSLYSRTCVHMDGCGFSGSAGRCRGMGRPAAQAGRKRQRVTDQGCRHVRLRFQVHVYAQICAFEFVTSERCFRFVFAGLCASGVGAAEPTRTDVASLDGGTAFTMGQGLRSASLVTVEYEAPALDTVVVDSQCALDTNIASESESAGMLTATVVHVRCAHVRKHRDAIHTCAHKYIHTYARAIAL